MIIILDSNILFSALIKNSTTRKIILESKTLFLYPEFIFEEFQKHKLEIFNKSQLTKNEFDNLFLTILQRVIIVPNELLENKKDEALKIVENIDINDVIFFACALTYTNSIIWSEDKKLKTQDKIKVLNTKEIIELISNDD
jgi:predicted nucleic acid-binding protein